MVRGWKSASNTGASRPSFPATSQAGPFASNLAVHITGIPERVDGRSGRAEKAGSGSRAGLRAPEPPAGRLGPAAHRRGRAANGRRGDRRGRHVRVGGGFRPAPAGDLEHPPGGPEPRGAGRAVADLCAHGDPALAQASDRAGAGACRTHLPGVVGGTGARLGRAGPDPPFDLDGLSQLVSRGHRRADRERGRCHRAGAWTEGGPCAACRAGWRRDVPCPARRPGERSRGTGGAAGAGAAGRLSGRPGPPRLGRHRLCRPRRPACRGDRARRDSLRQRRRGARGRFGRGRPDRPARQPCRGSTR